LKKFRLYNKGGYNWILSFGFWVLGFGFWVLGFGFWVLGFGFWVLGFGFFMAVRLIDYIKITGKIK
jgi:hypothetical protein